MPPYRQCIRPIKQARLCEQVRERGSVWDVETRLVSQHFEMYAAALVLKFIGRNCAC